ncbi:hypothetical protein DXC27_17510 [Ruminococcus sp. OM08-7]|nr:hypothetical protein DXC27_17510 [Ruminococcus sp. OM08-7]UVY00288.1 MAG: hypothetical protein [Bacteriophage sp.]
MPRARRKQFETFTDGMLSICKTEGRAIVDTKLKDIRFGNRTIGERRYFDAQTAGNKITKLLSIPAATLNTDSIESLDIVILNTQKKSNDPAQYKIVQIQEKFDATPPAIYLSLEKIVQLYKDRRSDNGG